MNSNATADLSRGDLRNKARAEQYLARSLRILKELEAERLSAGRTRDKPSNFVAEVRAILQPSR